MNTGELPEYSEGKFSAFINKNLHAPSKDDIPGILPAAVGFVGQAMNAFGPVKSTGDILQESGTSVGQGSGFSFQKQNSVDAGAQMDELSKQNTANTLQTAAAGAQLGSSFGPIGAGIGAVVGGVTGFIGGLSRKSKMAERIRNAQIQAQRNNNFNLASAQTDYLTNQYNLDHDNTQNGLLYHAKDGMVPGYDNGKANAKVSNGEVIVDTNTGEFGRMPGKPNKKDSLFVHLDNPDGTAIVSNNRLADGIRNSDYFMATGDLGGALMRDQIYRNMKDYRTVKQLGYGSFNAKNGMLPGFKYGKKDILADFNTAMDNASNLADEMRENNTLYKTPWELATGGTNQYWTRNDRLERTNPIKQDSSDTQPSNNWDNSNWANAITSAAGILGGAAQFIGARNEKLNRPDTYAPNPFDRQAMEAMASRRPNTNAKLAEMAHAEARNRYNINRMGGLGGAQRYLAGVASGIGLQRNIADVIGLGNQELNQYKGDWSKLASELGAQIAQRRQNANQYLEEAYARSHGARTQMEQMGMQNMLAAFNQYYKNLDKLYRFNRTMSYYDDDYRLRRDALNRGWKYGVSV